MGLHGKNIKLAIFLAKNGYNGPSNWTFLNYFRIVFCIEHVQQKYKLLFFFIIPGWSLNSGMQRAHMQWLHTGMEATF